MTRFSDFRANRGTPALFILKSRAAKRGKIIFKAIWMNKLSIFIKLIPNPF